MHQSRCRELQQIAITRHLQLELSVPVGCSEELCWGRSSGASVPAAQLHQAGSARLTLYLVRGTGFRLCKQATRLFEHLLLMVFMYCGCEAFPESLCRKGIGAGILSACPLEAGAKDLPVAYQRVRSTERGVWQWLIVFCERRSCDFFPLCLQIDSLSLLAPWKQAL